MARYDHLSIYCSAMRLAVHLENTVRGFPRYVKYTLGSEMRQFSQRIIGLVIRANGERERQPTLIELRELAGQIVGRVTLHQRDIIRAAIPIKPLRFTMSPFNATYESRIRRVNHAKNNRYHPLLSLSITVDA